MCDDVLDPIELDRRPVAARAHVLEVTGEPHQREISSILAYTKGIATHEKWVADPALAATTGSTGNQSRLDFD